MKRFHASLFAGIGIAVAPLVHAAGYSTNFNSFLLNDVAGQDGWVIDDATDDASYVSSISGWGRAATLGYVAPLAQPSVYLSHAVETSLNTTTFSVKFQVQDSFNAGTFEEPEGTSRDTFGFRLENASGDNLFSFYLNPFDQDDDPESDTAFHTYSWSTGEGTPTVALSGLAAQETFAYTLTVSFSQSGANDVSFIADINGDQFTGILAGLSAETVAGFGAFWNSTNGAEDPGTNFLIFDDVSVIPEPSAVLSGLFGISMAAMIRRRKS